MANLDDFIVSIAKAAGLDPETNEALKAIRTNEALAKIEVEPLLKNVVLTNLMNMNTAKNNPELLEHFQKKVGDEFLATKLNGIDAYIEKLGDEFEFSDETKAKLKSTTKTSGKLTVLRDELKEAYEKKGTSGKDKSVLLDEIKALNLKIKESQDSATASVAAKEAELLGKMQSKDYNSLLSSYNFATNDTMDRETAMIVADTKFKKLLAEKGLTLQYSPEGEEPFKVITNTGTDYYEQNLPVKFKAMLDKVVADNKLIQVSGGNTSTQTTATPQTMTTGGSKSSVSMNAAASEMETQIAKMESASQ